jgi:uncharacterized membrane protein
VQPSNLVVVIGRLLDFAGVIIIGVGALIASAVFGYRFLRGRQLGDIFWPYRQGVGRAILLGLEFLIAGDIIRTVAISPTLQSVAVLAAIVAIRTFLSLSLEVELNGSLPWKARHTRAGAGGRDGAATGQS